MGAEGNPKLCPTHRKQGICIDSRQAPTHVSRRYKCRVKGCKVRWTTAEFLIDTNKKLFHPMNGVKDKARHWVERKKAEGIKEAKAQLREWFSDGR